MRRVAEFAVAAGVAGALHLGAFAALGMGVPSGVESAGEGGDALVSLVSLVASDAGIAAMVEAWERPPELAVPEAVLPAPEMEAAPVAPAQEQVVKPLPVPELPQMPVAEAMPDLAALAPPPKPEAPPEPEPAPEPAPKPAAKPKPAPQDSEAQEAQVAAGQGGKPAAGNEGAAEVATASGAGADSLRAEWGADIRARIERRKSYPRDGDGAAGTVKLRIVVGTDGRLRGVAVIASSGSPALDAAALRAVERAGRFPRAPRGIAAGEASFTLPVSFRP